MSLWPSGPYRTEEVAFQASVNNVVHELGHAFANLWWTVDPETGAVEYSEDGPYHQLGLREHDYLLTNDGFQKGMNAAENLWRQHPENIPTPNEVFADMFLGWVYDQWLDDQNGERRQDYMGENMESWIQNITEWK
ncbi:MAG: hypothetical protein E4G99_08745 [Anaerolineales bacterium]|nr:MAG: hypothetical protein E4G99_08745 [Anaerolineales bacterium]